MVPPRIGQVDVAQAHPVTGDDLADDGERRGDLSVGREGRQEAVLLAPREDAPSRRGPPHGLRDVVGVHGDGGRVEDEGDTARSGHPVGVAGEPVGEVDHRARAGGGGGRSGRQGRRRPAVERQALRGDRPLVGGEHATDEELVAYVGDPTRCHPFGNWYPGLSPEQMQLAQIAALRTLTTREQFIMAADGPDAGDFVMPDQTLALLRLRDADPTFTAQRQTSDGVSWLIVRPVDDGCFLRELTTPQGYRAYALTDGGKQARADFIRFMYVPDDARPRVTPGATATPSAASAPSWAAPSMP